MILRNQGGSKMPMKSKKLLYLSFAHIYIHTCAHTYLSFIHNKYIVSKFYLNVCIYIYIYMYKHVRTHIKKLTHYTLYLRQVALKLNSLPSQSGQLTLWLTGLLASLLE